MYPIARVVYIRVPPVTLIINVPNVRISWYSYVLHNYIYYLRVQLSYLCRYIYPLRNTITSR